jgi:hypothetical protein
VASAPWLDYGSGRERVEGQGVKPSRAASVLQFPLFSTHRVSRPSRTQSGLREPSGTRAEDGKLGVRVCSLRLLSSFSPREFPVLSP